MTYAIPDEAVTRARERRAEYDATRVAVDIDASLEGWTPVDLTAIYDGGYNPPRPVLLAPDDRPGLFYRGAINCLYGDSGSGKSWLALRAAREELEAGGDVLWIDLESNGPEVVDRLRTIAVDRETITTRFHYVAPANNIGALVVPYIEMLVSRIKASMIVIDSIGEAFSIEGVNEDRDNEVGPWMRQVLRPLAESGAMVIVIDHATKAKDAPLYPSGSKRKRAAWTGAGYLVEARPGFTKDSTGWLILTTAKDRHGARKAGSEAARVVVDPDPDGGLRFVVHPPEDAKDDAENGPSLDSTVAEMVQAIEEMGSPDGVSGRAAVARARDAGVKGSTDQLRAALEEGVRLGHLIDTPGPRNSHLYRPAKAVIAAADEADS